MKIEDASLAANLERMRVRIAATAARCDRAVEAITIVAVSAGFPTDAICIARQAGQLRFAESRVEEWEDKRADIGSLGAIWHFIGPPTSNNAKRVVQVFDRVDSLDGLEAARELNEAAGGEKLRGIGFRLEVLIQVRLDGANLRGDGRQSGVGEAGLPALAEAVVALPNLELMGLMTAVPHFEGATEARAFFERLREVRDDLAERMDWPLRVLSVGVGDDFEIAPEMAIDIPIDEGATEIRLGRALFGEREA
jgi:pyridoxal phosphate enzyme (YggS family)